MDRKQAYGRMHSCRAFALRDGLEIHASVHDWRVIIIVRQAALGWLPSFESVISVSVVHPKQPLQKVQNGFNYEDVLPSVQDAVSRKLH